MDFTKLRQSDDKRVAIMDNRIARVFVKKDKHGEPVYNKATGEREYINEPITTFAAAIVEEITIDRGLEAFDHAQPPTEKHFVIEGVGADGVKLPTVRVTAKDFETLGWVAERWGQKAIIFNIPHARGAVVETIQRLSEPTRRTVYAHAGWREIDGRLVYIHGNGGVSADGHVPDISVELDPALRRVRLPKEPEDLLRAIRTSLSAIEIAPEAMTPVISTAYIAPLASYLQPDVVLHLSGETGGRKTTASVLAAQHMGSEFGSTTPRATVDQMMSWEDSAYSIEGVLFAAKDCLAVIDDFKVTASGDRRSFAKHLEKFSDILHNVGNRTGKKRRPWNGGRQQAVPSYPPRGVVLSTGELLPSRHSDLGRAMIVPFDKSTFGTDDRLAALSVVQRESDRLCHAMRGYVQWLAVEIARDSGQWRRRWQEVAEELRSAEGVKFAHARQPGNLAHLLVGIETFTRFAVAAGAITEASREAIRARSKTCLLGLVETQNEVVDASRPVERFVEILRTLVATGKVRFDPKTGTDRTFSKICEFHADVDLLGWADKDHLYVLPQEAYRLVSEYCRPDHFPATIQSLTTPMMEAGYVLGRKDEKDLMRAATSHRCDGRVRRVWQMPAQRVLDPDELIVIPGGKSSGESGDTAATTTTSDAPPVTLVVVPAAPPVAPPAPPIAPPAPPNVPPALPVTLMVVPPVPPAPPVAPPAPPVAPPASPNVPPVPPVPPVVPPASPKVPPVPPDVPPVPPDVPPLPPSAPPVRTIANMLDDADARDRRIRSSPDGGTSLLARSA